MLLRRTCLMVDWENASKAVEKVTTTTMTITTMRTITIAMMHRLGQTERRQPKLLVRRLKQSFKLALKLPKER